MGISTVATKTLLMVSGIIYYQKPLHSTTLYTVLDGIIFKAITVIILVAKAVLFAKQTKTISLWTFLTLDIKPTFGHYYCY